MYCGQEHDANHMLTVIHDITTNNIGSLCYHNTYKSIKVKTSNSHMMGQTCQLTWTLQFPLDTSTFSRSREKAELVRDFLIQSETFTQYSECLYYFDSRADRKSYQVFTAYLVSRPVDLVSEWPGEVPPLITSKSFVDCIKSDQNLEGEKVRKTELLLLQISPLCCWLTWCEAPPTSWRPGCSLSTPPAPSRSAGQRAGWWSPTAARTTA